MKNFILEAQSIQEKKIKKVSQYLSVGITCNCQKRKSQFIGKSSYNQFTTPVCKPQEEPRIDTELSGEFKLRTRKHRSFSHTGYKQL